MIYAKYMLDVIIEGFEAFNKMYHDITVENPS